MILYLLQYNNFYNRTLKRHETAAEYLPYLCESVLSLNPVNATNFIPNDGVFTEQIINWDGSNPDYLLAVEENGTINSRWFVIESVRTRAGQFKLTLYRDTLADYWDNIKSAPMFIEKGYCSIADNFVFNDEQITVNQIKKKETQLKDTTGCAWIVGYCSTPKNETSPTQITYGITADIYDYYVSALEDWDFYPYVSSGASKVKFVKNINFTFYSEHETEPQPGYIVEKIYACKFNKDGKISYNETMKNGNNYMNATVHSQEKIYETIDLSNSKIMYDAALPYYGLTDDVTLYETLQQFATKGEKAKRLKVGDGDEAKYYTIKLVANPQNQKDLIPNVNDNMYNAWKTWCQRINSDAGKNLISSNYKADSFVTNILTDNYHIELVESTPYSSLDFTWPINRKCLVDAPYCMFCMPYGEIGVIGNGLDFTTVPENALSAAAGIATSLDANLYDIQLLPYCPIPALRNSTSSTKEISFNREPFASWVADQNYIAIPNAKQIVIFCETSQDTFTIPVSYTIEVGSALQFKKQLLTKMVRLCSPNYNGLFEFNPCKNRGFSYVKVDYTYKPYQPYIHLAPDFGGLYEKDYADARGLICGGDFSLPIMTSHWNQYQIQNKTYQEQFNRQIENMEVQHKYAREQEIWGIIAGATQGVVSGGATGVFMGGGAAGGIAGGIAGGAISLAGGIRDLEINQALRDEAKDYTKDMFGLQLDNIKALPNSLTRISSFNNNNKIFPFFEEYDCSEEEVAAVLKKMIYNGFTIGRIDTLSNMIINKPNDLGGPGYFKGQLIRLEDIGDDSHIANAIAGELYKGVYI